MTPFITAFVGAVVVLAGAVVARNATRYAAKLDAAQRRRDAELAHLREFRDALVDALTYVSVYRYALSRVPMDIGEQNRFDEAMHLVEETGGRSAFRIEVTESLERLRNLAYGLLSEELRDAFRPLGDLLTEYDSPHEAAIRIDDDPDALDAFALALAAHHRQLLQTYPVAPEKAQ